MRFLICCVALFAALGKPQWVAAQPVPPLHASDAPAAVPPPRLVCRYQMDPACCARFAKEYPELSFKGSLGCPVSCFISRFLRCDKLAQPSFEPER